jgi:hypothetical protein
MPLSFFTPLFLSRLTKLLDRRTGTKRDLSISIRTSQLCPVLLNSMTKALRRYAKPRHTYPFCTHVRMRGLGKQLFTTPHFVHRMHACNTHCISQMFNANKRYEGLINTEKDTKKEQLFHSLHSGQMHYFGMGLLRRQKDIGCGYHLQYTYWTSPYCLSKHI